MRYAGFGPRLAAAIVDTMVFAPIIALSFWTLSSSREVALGLQVPVALLFAFYNIYFIGRWGQTVCKMAVRIKVVALDGEPAGFRRALYRHSVDLAFSLLQSALTMYALFSITSVEYDALGAWQRIDLLNERTSSVNTVIDWLYVAWFWSELAVLLMNEKRRALHDYIAGTVVIHIAEAPATAQP